MKGRAAPSCAARLIEIEKSFGQVCALDGVSLDINRGEVHALLGENGAGKTTLMRVLAGILQPDGGQIEIAGSPIRLRDRRAGARAGVGMVQQHFGLVDEFTGAENMLLGHPRGSRTVDVRRAASDLRRIGDDLGLPVEPDTRVANLTMGERQRLEILIALSADPAIVIFDEPTAALGGGDIGALGDVIRRLAAEGKAIVYITHKLGEVVQLADRVTVLRRGRVVETSSVQTASIDQLASAMVGSVPERRAHDAHLPVGKVIVGLCSLGVEPTRDRVGLSDIDLEVREGEILGVAGVVGNGQDALAGVLAGVVAPSHGKVDPAPARVAYIPEDRGLEGLATNLSIATNSVVHRHRERLMRRLGLLNRSAIVRFTRVVLQRGGIVAPDVDRPARTLSGGNQQRLVLSREFELNPQLIVANNPYRGLDIGAIAHVEERLLSARDARAAVVVISPDLDELLGIVDRLVVLFEGRVVGALTREDATPDKLGRMLAGLA